jgi:hypothetical protein
MVFQNIAGRGPNAELLSGNGQLFRNRIKEGLPTI